MMSKRAGINEILVLACFYFQLPFTNRVVDMFTICCALLMLSQPNHDSFDVAVKQALQVRRIIRTAHVRLNVEEMNPSTGQHIRKCDWEIWADGEKIRGDRKCIPTPDGGLRVVHIRNCEKNGWGFEFTDKPGLAARFGPMTPESRTRLYAAVHPGNFGYISSKLIDSWDPGFEGCFGLPNPNTKAVDTVKMSNQDCLKLSWTRGAGVDLLTLSAVIDPNRGYNVISHQVRFDQGEAKMLFSSVSELALWGKVWFPKKVLFEETLGDKVIRREIALITSATFNEPIAPEIFTRNGASLPARIYLLTPNPKESGVWDGDSVSPLEQKASKQFASPPVPATDPAERQWNPWLLALSIALGLAAVVLIVFKLRAKRAAS